LILQKEGSEQCNSQRFVRGGGPGDGKGTTLGAHNRRVTKGGRKTVCSTPIVRGGRGKVLQDRREKKSRFACSGASVPAGEGGAFKEKKDMAREGR